MLGRDPILDRVQVADATAPEIRFVHVIDHGAQRGIREFASLGRWEEQVELLSINRWRRTTPMSKLALFEMVRNARAFLACDTVARCGSLL